MNRIHQVVEHFAGGILVRAIGEALHEIAERTQRLDLTRRQPCLDAAHIHRLEQRHLRLPRERPECLERRIAYPAPRRGDRADKRGIVIGIRNQAQVRADILDLGLVEERLPTRQHIRYPLAPQHLFEDTCLKIAAIEDRVIAKLRAPLELVRGQPEHHGFRLVFFVVAAGHGDRVAHAVFGPQLLFEQLRVVRDHVVGGRQDTHRRTVVLLQLHQMQLREILAELREVFQRGAAPAVDSLVVVAHCRERRTRTGQQFQQLVLASVGVLILVDQQITQLVLPALADLLIFRKQFCGQADQIVKIHRLIGMQCGDVIAVDDRGLLLVLVGGNRDRLFRHDQAVLPQRNDRLDLADKTLVR